MINLIFNFKYGVLYNISLLKIIYIYFLSNNNDAIPNEMYKLKKKCKHNNLYEYIII